MNAHRILFHMPALSLALVMSFALTGCPDDDDDEADGGGGGDDDTAGECDYETYCGHYIPCGWYADQSVCDELPECRSSLASNSATRAWSTATCFSSASIRACWPRMYALTTAGSGSQISGGSTIESGDGNSTLMRRTVPQSRHQWQENVRNSKGTTT